MPHCLNKKWFRPWESSSLILMLCLKHLPSLKWASPHNIKTWTEEHHWEETKRKTGWISRLLMLPQLSSHLLHSRLTPNKDSILWEAGWATNREKMRHLNKGLIKTLIWVLFLRKLSPSLRFPRLTMNRPKESTLLWYLRVWRLKGMMKERSPVKNQALM